MNASAWHGPLSPVGAALGVVLVAVPYVLGVDGAAPYVALSLLGPVLGLVLLVAAGPLRQLGTGLIASALTYPLGLLGLVVLWSAG